MSGTSYTRQSTLTDGNTITAALFNDEYNKLVSAFTYSSTGTTGHRHDGTAGEGGNIHTVGDQDFLNKIVIDSSNNRLTFYVQVSSGTVEQLRIQDGAIVPVTDSDVDLGTSSLYFKDAYIDSITTTGNVAVGGNLTVTGTTTFNGGTLTLGDAAGDNVVFGADVNSNIIPNTDSAFDLGSSSQEWRDLYLDGTAHIDTLDVDVNATVAGTLGVTGVLTATSLDISGNVDIDGTLETDAFSINGTVVSSTAAELNILDGVTSTAAELNILDGVTSTTAELNILDGVTATTAELNILDGVTATATELNLIDGVTATTDELNILDGVTASAADINLIDGITNGTVIASKAIITDANIDITGGRNITISGELDAATLDISGNADIDGTLEADAITVNGTALASVIAGTTVANATTAAVATTVTITDNESTNENNAIIFTAGGDLDGGNLGLESDGDLKYNPSTGTLTVPNVSVSGTFSTVNSVTMDANNAVIFEGSTADAHETTLTSIDATADRTISLPNVSGTIPVLAAASDTAITSTPAELNILDGVTSTAAELNILDGVTSTAAELNILDGVTSTAAELNILDGVTSTAAELNILDGATAVVGEINALDLGSTAIGTAIASKAVILDSNKDYTGVRNLTISGELDAGSLDISGDADIDGTLETDALSLNGTAVTSTAAELNILDGVTSTAAELNILDGVTSTTAELNILDGVTSTAAELNILDGVTSTAAELNILDGVTSTATELNILDGVTATTAELNYLDIATLGLTAASKAVTADANGVITLDNGFSEEYAAVASSSAAVSLDLRTASNFSHDLTENTTISFANPAASGKVSAATLRIIQGSTARTITWNSSIKWASDTAPTLTTTDDGVDIFVFYTVDGGTTYYGFTAGQAMS